MTSASVVFEVPLVRKVDALVLAFLDDLVEYFERFL